MLHGHGDDGYRYPQPIRADFSTNVWYGGEPEGLKEHLFANWARVNRYPEVTAERLADQIAAQKGLQAGQVLVHNGTAESIYLLAQAFAGVVTTIVYPSFSEYEDACRLHGHTLRFVAWEYLDRLEAGSTLLFICHPNNPTGQTFPSLVSLLSRFPETIFVVDEAFIDFTDQVSSLIPLIGRYPNLLILQSLTKTYAIPGLRLGYVAGSEAVLDRVRAVRPPWTVNVLALETGYYLLDKPAPFELTSYLRERDDFRQQLQRISSLVVHPTDTHFFLCETTKATAADLKSWLVERHGLLIRDAGNFRGLSPRHFRLATLDPTRNQWLLNALTEWELS